MISALTLHQPWASLVLAGAKPFETRSWAPPERLIGGRFAVHAGLKVVRALPAPLAQATAAILGRDWAAVAPRGRLLCTVRLAGAWRTGAMLGDGRQATAGRVGGSPPLAAFHPDPFGDYAPGRWIWKLDDVVPLAAQPAARGRHKLWKLPDDLAALAVGS